MQHATATATSVAVGCVVAVSLILEAGGGCSIRICVRPLSLVLT